MSIAFLYKNVKYIDDIIQNLSDFDVLKVTQFLCEFPREKNI